MEDLLPLIKKAKDFINLCYKELELSDELEARIKQVEDSIKLTGNYSLLDFELVYGTKLAWRNSNKCIGRLFWRSMEVFDHRELDCTNSIFDALFEHIKFATNKGNIRSTISVFHPHKDICIWNPQLLGYAGYSLSEGKIVGDPKNIAFTKQCLLLGWEPKFTHFDILPLVIKIGDNSPEMRVIPKDIVTLVKIEHPNIPSLNELKMEWYSTPIISNMTLEIGGIKFKAAPFNGWYMGSEIGARNLSDEDRYNMLPQVAKSMGLDIHDKNSLWKDRALIELNQAVLFSFRKAGVKIIDHHSASKQFIQFMRQEAKEGRDVTADWSWIVPPISASTMEVFHTKMNNVIVSPNYFYQKEPWI